MVNATMTERTPNLQPVPPEWMARQASRGPSSNRNLNDVYWQKGAHDANPGWIIVGPTAVPGADGRPLTRQAERWMRKGRVPLIEYSYTNRISPLTGHRETIETNEDRLTTEDRYYWLFANGGAHLFPIEQIVAHHWHINPPYGLTTDVFPQLREWEVPLPHWCGACATATVPLNSEEELVTHLLITHRQTLPQARDLIASYDVHERPRGTRGLVLRRKAAAVERENEGRQVEPSPDQPRSKLIVCDACGESFANGLEKARHVKGEHPSAKDKDSTSQPADAMNGQAESDGPDA